MPLGNASIKRATGAIQKSGEKSKKAAFTASCALVQLEISQIKYDTVAFISDDLKKSIKKYGILHPVFVIREGDGFVLLSGKARMTVAAELNFTTVPAVVLTMEGSGVSIAKKDLVRKRVLPSALSEEIAVSDNIHEEKFNAVKSIGSELPEYLL